MHIIPEQTLNSLSSIYSLKELKSRLSVLRQPLFFKASVLNECYVMVLYYIHI